MRQCRQFRVANTSGFAGFLHGRAVPALHRLLPKGPIVPPLTANGHALPGAGHDSPLTRDAARQFNDGIDWLWKSAGAPAP